MLPEDVYWLVIGNTFACPLDGECASAQVLAMYLAPWQNPTRRNAAVIAQRNEKATGSGVTAYDSGRDFKSRDQLSEAESGEMFEPLASRSALGLSQTTSSIRLSKAVAVTGSGATFTYTMS